MKNYTENAKKSLEMAEELAILNGNVIDSTVLLAALLKNKRSTASVILAAFGLTEDKAESYLLRKSKADTQIILLTDTVKKILDYAEKQANEHSTHVNTVHILLGVTHNPSCTAAKILESYNIHPDTLSDIQSVLRQHGKKDIMVTNKSVRVLPDESSINPEKQDDFVDYSQIKYVTDLTQEAKGKRLNTIIGMENELTRLLRVLSRTKKNNALLIGESGVGKTSLVYLLAQKIAEGDVPSFIQNRTVLSIHLHSLIAGTKYRGEMEEKFDELFDLTQQNNCILFFDDIHNIITAGTTDNNAGVGAILKPIMEKSRTLIIGATTYSAFGRYMEKDPSFERLFTKIHIKEPHHDALYSIMIQAKQTYEKHYSIEISQKAIQSAIDLSIRYLPDRHLPDKALDLLDETCSMVVSAQKSAVTDHDIKAVLTEMTGIPISDETDDRQRFLQVNDKLRKKIIGQDEAIDAISQCLLRAKAGFREKAKPIGSFLFLGNTGVGKTETAKALAEILFGSQKNLIRLDMSEYSDKNSVSKLIGAPPGYVGYEEGGYLTERVKNNPFSVILFDEIEKANLDIYDTLLQVLDDGRITDSKGNTVDFRNTIIIMTSNIGSQEISNKHTIGFTAGNTVIDENNTRLQALKRMMKPEFINRIDSIIFFKRLDKENLSVIADNMIREKEKILFKERGITLHLSTELRDEILNRSIGDEYGARPLRRVIEKLLENELSERILEGNLMNTDIFVTFKNGRTEITVK